MNDLADKQREEVEKNFAAIARKMDEYIKRHENKFALMKDKEVIAFYDTHDDAYTTGMKFCKDGVFSIQKVTNTPVDLGHFSHVASIAQTYC